MLGLIAFAVGAGGMGPGAALAQARSVEELERMAGHDPNEPQLYYQLGREYLRTKRYDEAVRVFRAAIDISSQHAEAHLGLGYAALLRGDKYWKKREKAEGREAIRVALDSSFSSMRHAFLINPLVQLDLKGDVGDDDVTLVIGSLVFRPWWSQSFRKGANLVMRGKLEEGYAELAKLRDDPRFGERGLRAPGRVLWYHAIAAGRTRRFDEAVRDFAVLTGRSFHEDTSATESMVEMPFRTNDYRYAMGTMMLLAGRTSDATAVFRRVLEFDIGMWPAHVQLARMSEAEGRLEQAIVERQRAVEVFPEDGTLHLELARVLSRAGRNDDALASLRDAEVRSPKDPRIPYLQAELLLAAGRDGEAKVPLERFIALAPARLEREKEEARIELARIAASTQPSPATD